MKHRILLIIFATFLTTSFAFAATVTAPTQDGLILTTTIDTDLHEIYFDFDLRQLPDDYEQIVFKPPMFPLAAIPFVASSVTAASLTEWNLHGLWPGGTPSLELQFMTTSPPPRETRITIKYDPLYQFTGNFLGAEGDENLVLSMRDKTEAALWVYSPELVAVPTPAAVWLFGSGLLGLIGMARRKKA